MGVLSSYIGSLGDVARYPQFQKIFICRNVCLVHFLL